MRGEGRGERRGGSIAGSGQGPLLSTNIEISDSR